MQQLEQRIEKLERQAKHYRMAFIGLCLVMVAVITIAAMPQSEDVVFDTVTCKNLMVYTKTNLLAAWLGTDEDDNPSFSLFKNFFSPVEISIGENGGKIAMTDTAGKTTILMVNDEIGGKMFIAGSTDKLAISMGNDETGGFFSIKNKRGEDVVQLSANEYGNGVVGAYDRNGKGRTLEPR